MPIYLPELDPSPFNFPDINTAHTDPDGLLAFGGDLSCQRLINAYQRGIFPWFETGQPILWWSPSKRMVIKPGEMHISRSLKKSLRNTPFTLSINKAFDHVITACAKPRSYSQDTWITNDMQQAFKALHKKGYAHSVEVWNKDELVGGLYGLSIGKVFCGESMFHTKSNASKIAFIGLQQHLLAINYQLIDCQLHNPHLQSLGAVEVPRNEFVSLLINTLHEPASNAHWYSQALSIDLKQ